MTTTAIPVTATRTYQFTDLLPASYYHYALREDLRRGLSSPTAKETSPTWFYDAHGSNLYEKITQLPNYYPFLLEEQLLRRRADAIAERTRATTLVELGSGSSTKTRILLDSLATTLDDYIPMDVSDSALHTACAQLASDYPALAVHGLRTDFLTTVELPRRHGPRLFAFLGSTIGNLRPRARIAFLNGLRNVMLPGDYLLLGVDLVKEPQTMIAAYDDAVTSEFNLNVLRVFNREAGADFSLDAFTHRAVWNAGAEQIEMHLVSAVDQVVTLSMLDMTVPFAAGEHLLTEISSKFTRGRITSELAAARLEPTAWFTDTKFALTLAAPQ